MGKSTSEQVFWRQGLPCWYISLLLWLCTIESSNKRGKSKSQREVRREQRRAGKSMETKELREQAWQACPVVVAYIKGAYLGMVRKTRPNIRKTGRNCTAYDRDGAVWPAV
jgi:hypothetical protein